MGSEDGVVLFSVKSVVMSVLVLRSTWVSCDRV